MKIISLAVLIFVSASTVFAGDGEVFCSGEWTGSFVIQRSKEILEGFKAHKKDLAVQKGKLTKKQITQAEFDNARELIDENLDKLLTHRFSIYPDINEQEVLEIHERVARSLMDEWGRNLVNADQYEIIFTDATAKALVNLAVNEIKMTRLTDQLANEIAETVMRFKKIYTWNVSSAGQQFAIDIYDKAIELFELKEAAIREHGQERINRRIEQIKLTRFLIALEEARENYLKAN